MSLLIVNIRSAASFSAQRKVRKYECTCLRKVARDVTNVAHKRGLHLTQCMLASMLQSTYNCPILSEPTGLVVLQWFNRDALTIAPREMLRRPGKYHHHHHFI